MSDYGKNLERWRRAVATHDTWNPTHTSYGIGLAFFDMERLGLTEGEELWDGITVQCDGKGSGHFRVLCDGEHGRAETLEEKAAREREQETTRVVSRPLETVPA